MSDRSAPSAEEQFVSAKFCALDGCGRTLGEFSFVCTQHGLAIHREARAILNATHIAGADVPPPPPPTSVLYYLRLGGYIKIGTTTNLRERVSTLKASQPDVEILATEPGGRERESQRHQQFAARRLPRSELFVPGPTLQQHIHRMRHEHGTPTPVS